MRHTLNGLWSALLRPPIDPNTNPLRHMSPTLWLPSWIWLLVGVAIIAAGWYRRRSTLVLLVLGLIIGVMFVEWPEHAIWNTRFLPFWMLTWAFVAAMGATEIARFVGDVGHEGLHLDTRRRSPATRAPAPGPRSPPRMSIPTSTRSTPRTRARKRRGHWPIGSSIADRRVGNRRRQLAPAAVTKIGRRYGAIAIAVVVVFGGIFALNRGFDAAGNNPAILIRGWAAWNYAGYEQKADYPQYSAVMTGMEQVADQYGDGRALWEPSSGDPDAINSYGTSLALELLPYFTHGKIDSMEGIYFESSATTDYHFLTVSECAQHPSNPVRGLVYGSANSDFDLCVRHLQMLGVRYYMAWTPEMQKLAGQSSQLKLVKTIPQNPSIPGPSPDKQLTNWKVYEVANSDLVVGLDKEPVVLTSLPSGKKNRTYSKCWGQAVGQGDRRRAEDARRLGVHDRAVVDEQRHARHRVRADRPEQLDSASTASDLAQAQPKTVERSGAGLQRARRASTRSRSTSPRSASRSR